jgi:hypothetical protein
MGGGERGIVELVGLTITFSTTFHHIPFDLEIFQ